MFRPNATSVFMSIAEVTDHLYLCAARAVTVRSLREKDVSCVINATIELPNLPVSGVEYLKVAVDDSPFANIAVYFDKIADKIHETRRSGGKTLVHCLAGVSRSATLCLAYLMKYANMSLRDAYDYLKTRRPIIRPNNGFFRQLIEYERKLHNRETVSLVSSAAGLIPDVYEQDYRNMMLLMTPPPSACANAASANNKLKYVLDQGNQT